jgi:hypothetical protein
MYDKRVKALREKKDWTQGELAERLGINQGTVSRWEQSIAEPTGLSKKAIDRLLERAGL